MSALFTPLKMRGLTLSNRIVVSPMCQYSADQGQATAWHMVHLNTLALSGAGMLCIEATSVEAEGRITPGDLGLYDDATEAALRPVLNAIRRNTGTAVVVQLAHAGRKASCAVPWEGGEQMPPGEGGWLTHAPSAIAHKSGESTPQVLDAAGLDRIRSAFAASARRAAQLGLDGIEIHAAHGYLLHEFLSPLSNQRTDEYGGSLANRMRFPLEVFDAARAAFPATQPVGLRLSATDWTDGGWDLEQSIAFAAELAQRGVDWVDASSGGISPQQKIPTAPGYQVAFAAAIKQATGVNTVAVGLITQTQQAEDIVAGGKADLVALARGMLYDPRWGWHAAAALGASVSAPPQYWRAAPHGHQGLFKLTS
jgi:2,4-dienoyl-CoA reductase-like NADH-dependent reductase (Old Yellow Enzyme family)